MPNFEQLVRMVRKLQREFIEHRHTGLDSKQLDLTDQVEPVDTLTPTDTSTVDDTYDASEAAVIDNTRTRVDEMEDALKEFGILE